MTTQTRRDFAHCPIGTVSDCFRSPGAEGPLPGRLVGLGQLGAPRLPREAEALGVDWVHMGSVSTHDGVESVRKCASVSVDVSVRVCRCAEGV